MFSVLCNFLNKYAREKIKLVGIQYTDELKQYDHLILYVTGSLNTEENALQDL